jgi:hypothetical protein
VFNEVALTRGSHGRSHADRPPIGDATEANCAIFYRHPLWRAEGRVVRQLLITGGLRSAAISLARTFATLADSRFCGARQKEKRRRERRRCLLAAGERPAA